MGSETRSHGSKRGSQVEAVFEADRSAKLDPEKDLTEERKNEWAKRIAIEDEKAKKGNEVVSFWYEKQGHKLIKKISKKKGGTYSFYMGNLRKRPDLLTEEVQSKLKVR